MIHFGDIDHQASPFHYKFVIEGLENYKEFTEYLDTEVDLYVTMDIMERMRFDTFHDAIVIYKVGSHFPMALTCSIPVGFMNEHDMIKTKLKCSHLLKT